MRIFVAEKGGTLGVGQNGSVLATPFLTVNVNTASERGLVGVTLDPNVASDGFVYVYYTTSAATPVNRVSRFTANTVNPNVAQTGSEVVLVDNIPSTKGNHNGGALQFGPDGDLYIGVGDSGVSANAQDLTTLSGKLLRVNPTNGSAPADNPFVSTLGARPEIWAYGLRNPFTIAFQPGTGVLFINDVGENSFEEVDQRWCQLRVAEHGRVQPSERRASPTRYARPRHRLLQELDCRRHSTTRHRCRSRRDSRAITSSATSSPAASSSATPSPGRCPPSPTPPRAAGWSIWTCCPTAGCSI